MDFEFLGIMFEWLIAVVSPTLATKIIQSSGVAMRQITLFIMLLVYSAAFSAVDITIDHQTRYQTIVGFGGQASGSSEQAHEMVTDMGLSVIRVDWCEDYMAAKPFWDAGCRTIVGSCWSPPAYMKTNGQTGGGGSLKPEMYDDFTNFAIERLRAFETGYGGPMYALSPQNEPAFAVFYKSCTYEGEDLIRIAQMIGERMEAENIDTKLMVHEDMYYSFFDDFLRALIDNPQAQQYVDALAFHGYTADGVSPAEMNASYLQRMNMVTDRYGYELWQTENAGSMGLPYATDVIACLRYGKVSMYLKYGLSQSDVGMVGSEDEFYYFKGNKTITYYVAKTISKFIRPGAVQLRSVSSDSTEFTNFVAFYDENASTLTVTLATGDSPQTISLSGTDLPSQFDMWLTTSSVKCENQGTVSPDNITIPANGVVALVGRDYTPPAVATAVDRPAPAAGVNRAMAVQSDHAGYYSIQGRYLGREAAALSASAGVYLKSDKTMLTPLSHTR
jgi:O-glycosyl hydrolase